MFITISTSSAPCLIARLVSQAFTSDSFMPAGKLATVQTLTGDPANLSRAMLTNTGATQTE